MGTSVFHDLTLRSKKGKKVREVQACCLKAKLKVEHITSVYSLLTRTQPQGHTELQGRLENVVSTWVAWSPATPLLLCWWTACSLCHVI